MCIGSRSIALMSHRFEGVLAGMVTYKLHNWTAGVRIKFNHAVRHGCSSSGIRAKS
jgi:hypothetical protein